MRARDSQKITGRNETVLRALLEKSSGKIVSVPDQAYAQEGFSYTNYSDIYIFEYKSMQTETKSTDR